MKLQVFQIDAWIEPDGTWRYNNSIPICKIEVKGTPTKNKITRALRAKNLLSTDYLYKVDDYFVDQGIWSVQLKKNEMPLYDLLEEV